MLILNMALNVLIVLVVYFQPVESTRSKALMQLARVDFLHSKVDIHHHRTLNSNIEGNDSTFGARCTFFSYLTIALLI